MIIRSAFIALCVLTLADTGRSTPVCRDETIFADPKDIAMFRENQVALDDPSAMQMWNRAARRSSLSLKARARGLTDPLLAAVESLEVPDACFSVCKGKSGPVFILTACSAENCGDKTAAIISNSIKAVGLRRERGLEEESFEFYFRHGDERSLKLLSAWAVLEEYSVDYSRGYGVALKVDYDQLREARVRSKICSL